jgi:hypothetical protein
VTDDDAFAKLTPGEDERDAMCLLNAATNANTSVPAP